MSQESLSSWRKRVMRRRQSIYEELSSPIDEKLTGGDLKSVLYTLASMIQGLEDRLEALEDKLDTKE